MRERRPSSHHRDCFGPAASFGALQSITSTSIKHSSPPRNGYQTHLPHLSPQPERALLFSNRHLFREPKQKDSNAAQGGKVILCRHMALSHLTSGFNHFQIFDLQAVALHRCVGQKLATERRWRSHACSATRQGNWPCPPFIFRMSFAL